MQRQHKPTGKHWLKFYSDTPWGEVNKMHCYQVQHFDHAQDLLVKFHNLGKHKIRSAFYENPMGVSTRIDKITDYANHTRRIDTLAELAEIELELNKRGY
jgi:hypothetical protein